MPRLGLSLSSGRGGAKGPYTLSPVLLRDFVSSRELNPAGAVGSVIAYTGGGGTYFDENGTMFGATTNQPRWDYDPDTSDYLGLLIEPSRTNLYTDSFVPQPKTITLEGSKTYQLSFYGDTGATINFSGATSGVLQQSSSSTRLASLQISGVNGDVTFTPSAGVTYPQLEEGLFPTSHIPTGSTAATRTADTLRMDILTRSSGTMVCEFKRSQPYVNGQSHTGLGLRNVVTGGGFALRAGSSDGNTLLFRGNINTSTTRTNIATNNLGIFEKGKTHRLAGCFSNQYAEFSLDGSTVGSVTQPDNLFNPTGMTKIDIGNYMQASTSYLCGHIRGVELYRFLASTADLNALSSSSLSSSILATASAPFEQRTLSPNGLYNGRTFYSFGDEELRWTGSQWEYVNSGLGVLSTSSSDVMMPSMAKSWTNGATFTRI